MKYKSDYKINGGEKVGNHILVEHINSHKGLMELPMAVFKCGLCGNKYTTTISAAKKTKSCGCSKIKYKININEVVSIIKENPFIKIRNLAIILGVSYAVAQTKRNEAFRLL